MAKFCPLRQLSYLLKVDSNLILHGNINSPDLLGWFYTSIDFELNNKHGILQLDSKYVNDYRRSVL